MFDYTCFLCEARFTIDIKVTYCPHCGKASGVSDDNVIGKVNANPRPSYAKTYDERLALSSL